VFSQRTGWRRETTALAQAVAARRAEGLPLIDLAASNPTRCGFAYSGGAASAALLAPLASDQSLRYEPDPLGLLSAREAVCGYYRDHGAAVGPDQVVLTTSTSEAYSFLFRLLCDPGDEVLIAQPSYPLFDFLADLDDVRLVSYPLLYDHGWQTEPRALEARITARTRAIVVVHPNNPTGHYVSASDRAALERVCVQHGLALIVDEVFLDYAFNKAAASFAAQSGPALTFVLSGLSKVAALPQMKASWIVALGPDAPKREALARLELVADTFLSLNAPVQHALPAWLAGRAGLQQQIAARTRTNLARLDSLFDHTVASRLAVEAGWCAVLRVPALGSDDALVLALAEDWGVLVHPGHYYGFSGDGWLVVSLLPLPNEFEQGIQAVLACSFERVQALSR
jgi:aspartate/methionine/tyrosine aminotransferase